ncbi:MAG TPA: WYL domain-containing protein [Acidimicrobiales bacterium]|nr:WYL domain-containing protein [Acidimicrobiales bacterium]
MEDRFERLTNLVAFLLNTAEGVSFARIIEEIPGWPEGDEARRRAFERDKRLLRDEGIPLVEERGLYRIPADDFYLPDLGLSDAERVALRLAVAAVPGTASSGTAMLHKLTLGGLDGAAPVVAALDPQPLLPELHEAIRTRTPIRFRYEGSPDRRTLEPSLLFFRDGNWYVAGHDRDRGAERTFRVDRIQQPVEALAGQSFEPSPPAPADQVMPRQPWLYGDAADTEEAIIDVDALLAAKAAADVGARGSVERRADGSVRITMPVSNRDAFRTWVLGLLDHAVVVAPPGLRADIVGWLEDMAG